MTIICEVQTCRVQTDRKPVSGLPVWLRCAEYPQLQFEGFTDSMGTISKWYSTGRAASGEAGWVESIDGTSWRMTFQTMPYFPTDSLPRVNVDFYIRRKAGYRIIVLLDEDSYGVIVQTEHPIDSRTEVTKEEGIHTPGLQDSNAPCSAADSQSSLIRQELARSTAATESNQQESPKACSLSDSLSSLSEASHTPTQDLCIVQMQTSRRRSERLRKRRRYTEDLEDQF